MITDLPSAQAVYLANASYDVEVDGVLAAGMARLFVGACRALVMLLPTASADERTRVELAPGLIQRQLEDAMAWLRGKGLTEDPRAGTDDQGVTLLDMSDYRHEHDDDYRLRGHGGIRRW